jgi:hypothetical protein
VIGEQYFAGSFLENELAQLSKGYETVTKLKELKKLQGLARRRDRAAF